MIICSRNETSISRAIIKWNNRSGTFASDKNAFPWIRLHDTSDTCWTRQNFILAVDMYNTKTHYNSHTDTFIQNTDTNIWQMTLFLTRAKKKIKEIGNEKKNKLKLYKYFYRYNMALLRGFNVMDENVYVSLYKNEHRSLVSLKPP